MLLRPLLSGLCAIACVTATAAPLRPDSPKNCSSCAEWNRPQAPFVLHGKSWFVGTRGLSSVLIDSGEGLVLLDGALPESAPLIAANIETLGFRLDQIRYIAVSHAHYDHVGGVAALARASGATVIASARSADALIAGVPPQDDPQAGFGDKANGFPKLSKVQRVADGETLRLGKLVLTAHYTPGHTAGATTWSWQDCSGGDCVNLVYADSLNAVSDDAYRFGGADGNGGIAESFRASIDRVAKLPCDILVTVHPGFAKFDEKLAQRAQGAKADPFIDASACRRYADSARERLDARLREERAPKP
ncbi:MAG TPA: subclass B3 metallo-beta-lactamase [Tahibacter sp.]|uniref:subclass B3 metallo-beta-lactamase n=1 Tax=Tahibacter sp. TaxID=2056211 RepID=UPI002CA653C5|nr:subclass B3 metallo-beta-lactamase [Tahibacter sp.]HSX62572.1 subclass B3 metallo-beta-lactamase [Tahibacter sp.]